MSRCLLFDGHEVGAMSQHRHLSRCRVNLVCRRQYWRSIIMCFLSPAVRGETCTYTHKTDVFVSVKSVMVTLDNMTDAC